MPFSCVCHFIPRAGGRGRSHSGNSTRLGHSSHSVDNGMQRDKTQQRRVSAAVRIQMSLKMSGTRTGLHNIFKI